MGSAAHCDVVINHHSVQPEHARAWIDGGRIWIQDLGGPTGTALNEIRLPELKPMLVRDLDVFRLGQSDATLSLEAILVRAPTFKKAPISSSVHPIPTAAPEPPKPIEAKGPVRDMELEKRREELANVGRELAQVRLHLQMAQLEKNSTEEMTQQLQNLRSEIQQVQEQKAKWNLTLQEIEAEKKQIRSAAEVEVGEFKNKYAAEMKAQMERDLNRLAEWKKETVPELMKAVRTLSTQKAKSWAARTFSQDLIFEWEEELNLMFRRVLLKEKVNAPSKEAHPKEVTQTLSGVHPLGSASSEPSSDAAVSNGKRKGLGFSRQGEVWKSRGVKALMGMVVVTALWTGYQRLKTHPLTGFSSQSSEATERKPRTRFVPKQNRKYRNTYTDNVLYLENYVAAEQNQDFRKLWQTELNRAATKDWKVDAALANSLVNKEQILIMDLNHLRDGIFSDRESEGVAQMRSREAQFIRDSEALLKGHANYDRFTKFKRAFYIKNQSYLSADSK